MIFTSKKGISLYFAVVITAILLAIVLGLTTILVGQMKMLKGMGDSVIAFFTADTGMEKILYIDDICRKENCTSTSFVTLCENEAYKKTGTTTNPCLGLFQYSTSSQLNSASYNTTASSTAGGIIFNSMGIYKSIKRALEVTRKP